jgi:chemotaxis protein methyltransferase WspC
MMRHAFSPARIPLAFAFTRTPAEEARPPRQAPIASALAAAAAQPAGPITPVGPISPVRPPPPVRQPAATARAAGVGADSAGRVRASLFSAGAPSQARSQSATHSPRATASHTDTAHAAPASADPRAKRAALLADASRLADEGRLDQAERVANQCVNIHGPDASVFYLLGLIMDARGRAADAGDYYRKALYLEPTHYEALTHLAALLEITGDAAGAGRLTRRAERAAQALRDTPERRTGAANALNPVNRTRGFHD